MSLYLQRTLVILACAGVLSACGDLSDDDSEDTSSTYVVYAMSSVESGYQTFQQRALDYDGDDIDDSESTYVYKDRENDESTSVVFNSANDSDTDTEDLVVKAFTDINDTYTAFSIDDVSIKVDGVNHRGDYILIQDKESGSLYPVMIADDDPLLNTELTDEVYWHSEYRNSNLADEDRIYINDSTNEKLYVFEFEDDVFTYVDNFSYQGNTFWINEDGDILTQDTDSKGEMALFDRSSSETISETFSTSKLYPFVYEGEFYTARSDNSVIYDLVVESSDFYWDDESEVFASNDDDYTPATNAARRGDYEMSANCELYEFDASNPYAVEINFIDDFDADNGQLAAAGQDALFCVHADSSSDSASAIITKFDMETEVDYTFETSEGDLSDAADYFTVISDDEVMFSEKESSSFDEYYINVVNASEDTIEVSEASIIGLQRLEN